MRVITVETFYEFHVPESIISFEACYHEKYNILFDLSTETVLGQLVTGSEMASESQTL